MASRWDHFGITLGSCWDHSGIMLGSFWNRFGIILGCFWDHFGVILMSFWPWESPYPPSEIGSSPFEFILSGEWENVNVHPPDTNKKYHFFGQSLDLFFFLDYSDSGKFLKSISYIAGIRGLAGFCCATYIVARLLTSRSGAEPL